MRLVLGLLLLLCEYGAQGESGGLGVVDEVSDVQRSTQRDGVEELAEPTTAETISYIWAEVRALRDMVVELQVELRIMDERLKDSDVKVEELKTELIITKMLLEQLQRENTVQAQELISLETRTSNLEENNSVLQGELLSSVSRIDQLEKENAALQGELLSSVSRIDQLEKENAEKPKVAFYTSLTDAGHVGPYNTDVTLKYNKVFTNIGNAYNPATGFFTAPFKGVYYLQFTVCGNQAGSTGAYLYKNGQRIIYNSEWKEEAGLEYFTNSVILELLTGDEINLRLPSGHSIYDSVNNHSTFSGSLLFPL